MDLGNHAPRALGLRLLKGITPDLAVQVEIDTVYQGSASISIEVTIRGGIRIPARIYLNALAGKLRVRWPCTEWPDMIGITFVEDPGATFTIDAPLSSKTSEAIRNMVNRLLESIARKLFKEMWVMPSWRSFFMPMMNPTFEVCTFLVK